MLEAMIMLKTAWNEVSSKTIVNCFRKSGISEDARKAAIDDQDDPFKDMINDAEDESADGEENEAIDELQFDLDQLRKVRPDMAPKDLDADSLVDFNDSELDPLVLIMSKKNQSKKVEPNEAKFNH